MHLFCPGEPLSFVHPLIRQAVERSISPLAWGQEHARAAQVLDGDGQPEEVVAPHLLAAPAQADPRTVDDSPRRRAQGAGQRRGEQRRRPAAPGAGGGRRGGLTESLLAELAQAEVQAGLPEAAGRLGDAIEPCARSPASAPSWR